VRWLILAGLIGFAIWHWAGEPMRVRAILQERLKARAKPGPCALPLDEVRRRMAYHGTLVAYCDSTGWKFPRKHRICRLWAK